MYNFAFLIGALLPTFVISRITFLLLRSWNGGLQRLFVAHGISLLLAAFIGGMGMADGGAFAGFRAAGAYAVPQAIWLIIDYLRYRNGKPELLRRA